MNTERKQKESNLNQLTQYPQDNISKTNTLKRQLVCFGMYDN